MTLWGFVSRHRAFVWFLAGVLALGGLAAVRALPSGIYPEVEFPRVVVVARSGDAPPDVTQLTVTRPLEAGLATVLGVERIRSRTIRGNAELSLQFAPGTDMWRALQLVSARSAELRNTLPAGTELIVERLSTTSFPVVTFNLSGADDPRTLRDLAELVLKPAISRVRGVGRVEVLGGDVRELEVVLDVERAAALKLTPQKVADLLRAHAQVQAVGRLEANHSALTVMANGEFLSADEVRAFPLATGPQGSPVPVSAVATVFEGAEDRLLRVSGPGGETVLVSVSRLPGASTPEVVNAVRAAMNELSTALPAGVRLTPVYDQAQLVDESIGSVRDAIVLGIALCVLVIALFLRDVRAGLAAAAAIPFTLAITFVPMVVLGQSLNLMSLGGLAVAVGLVIDDAIVVVEGIDHRRALGLSLDEAAAAATRSLFSALLGTTLTTIVVFLPLAWLEGLVGRFFSALAVTLTLSVAFSLVLSLTIVPLLMTSLAGPRRSRGAVEKGRFEGVLARLLRRPSLGLVVAGALLVLGGVAWRFVPTGFLPEMDEGAFVLDYFLPAGTSLTETDQVARRIDAVLRETKGVATFSRRTGAELGPAAATQVNRGDIMVRLVKRSERDDAEAIISSVRARLEREVPEARVEFVQVLQDVLNDLSGNPRPVELKLLGSDYATLRTLADEVAGRVKDVPGLVDLYGGVEGLVPELRVRFDPVALARLGLTAQDVTGQVDAALHGSVAAQVRRADRPVGIRVRADDGTRFDVQHVEALPIVTPANVLVPLTTVATVERPEVESVLLRESLRPAVILQADHEGRDLGAISRDVASALRGLKLPDGYQLELGGQAVSQRETLVGLLQVMGFGVLAVLAVLLLQFRASRLAFTLMATVPLAVVGALTTLWATQVPLNASSLMGCVLLVGLVVKNGILLLEQFEHELTQGAGVTDALLKATALRTRPIVMTTVATLAGLLPLALGLGSGAELQRPLAVAVSGGLVTSTAASLLVLPCLVLLTYRRETQ